MNDRTYTMFINDIISSIKKIREYIENLSYQEFRQDTKTVDAVLRNLEIIGEASRNIREDVRKKFPNIPWRRMIGLRNIVSHAYFGVDLELIWEIVSKNLPGLEAKIKNMLKDYKK